MYVRLMKIDIVRQRFKYLLSDYICLNIGWFLCALVRYQFLPPDQQAMFPLSNYLTYAPVIIGQCIIPIMMIAAYWISGYYNEVYFKSRSDEIVNTAAVSAIGVLIIYFAAMINDTTNDRIHSYELIGILWLLLFIPVLIGRVIITNRTSRLIKSRKLRFPTLVVGATLGAMRIADRLNNSVRGAGFDVVGYVDTTKNGFQRNDLGLPVYPFEELQRVCEELGIKRLVVAPHHNGFKETGELINSLFHLNMPIYITPDLYGLIVMRPRIGNVTDEPMVDITQCHTKAVIINLKRLSDFVLGIFACILLLPVYAAIAVAIKRDSKGPVFYSQERIGYHKHPFKIFKFRTMTTDAEAAGPALTTLDDPRVTKIGHFLRKYRLDELPQFWNVVRGDMSLVGPRPERDFYIRQIVAKAPYYNLIHQVRPGITSWGMVKFGYASTDDQMIERLRYDLIYIENVSLGVDIKILYHTVNTVLTGKGL